MIFGNVTAEEDNGLKPEKDAVRGTLTSSWGSSVDHIHPKEMCSNFFKVDNLISSSWAANSQCLAISRVSTIKLSGRSMTTIDHDEVVGMADVSKAIELLYKWEHDKKGRIASTYAVYFVERNFSERNMRAVNTLLLNASVERLTEWSMIALLRASYSARDVLPAWPLFLRSVRHCLRDNDKADRLLMGLDG